MSSRRARTFTSAGIVSRGAVLLGAALAALAAVTAVVVAQAGSGDEKVVAVDSGRHVIAAAEGWLSENASGCPTITQLVDDGRLESDARTDDPWGNRFRIVCEGAHARVRSAGPDRRAGTPDDLAISRDNT